MDSKSEIVKAFGCGAAVETSHGLLKADGGCSLSHIHSCSQLSGISVTPETSAPNIVYERRRLLKNPATLPRAPGIANMSTDNINLVYERRKRQGSACTKFPTIVSANMSHNGACTSTIRSKNPAAASSERRRGSNETGTTRISTISATVSNKELPLMASETIDECLAEDHGSNVKDKINKTVELYSVGDSCSSSMLNMDVDLSPWETKIDDSDECSSSGALLTDLIGNDQSLSVKCLCLSILQSHGLLSDSRPNRSGGSEEGTPSCSGGSYTRSCNTCGVTGTSVDMLICDECEEAFHVSCINPSIRKIPTDDWYCQSCFKTKRNLIKERAVSKSSIIRTEKGSVTSERDSSPISLMLNDTRSYITCVRIGKGFQAIVPEWSGPIARDISVVPEPMVLDPSHSVNLPGLISGKPRRSNFIGNWIQCRQVIIGIGDSIDGTICGKWRRAPLFEVLTDNWDCFHSVHWDPTHADCCVPQELDTAEVLKQLKYMEMLRPRLAAKRRKFEIFKANGAEVPAEGASKCENSVNVVRNS